MDRDNLNERFANLSPIKRVLLERRLKERGLKSVAAETIPRRPARDSAFLSFAQQRLWFLNQLEPESPAYNEARAVRLVGRLYVQALEKALNQIVARHEVLRTTIVLVNGTPLQKIANNRAVELSVVDLQAWTDTERDAEAQRLISEVVRRPFDLSRELMLRALLFRLAAEEHILLFVTHHIASDGWSSGILWNEVTTLYRAFASGQPCPLSELPIQYADYAVWQRHWLQGEVLEAQLSYWRKQLDNISTLKLPTDRLRPSLQTHWGARQSFVLSENLSEALKALSRKEGATLFMTLLAAFQTLLYRYTGQKDFAVGSPIAGRTRQELESLIGFFVNTLVLKTDFSGNPTFQELLLRARETALGAYTHQDLPFDKLVEELQPERNLNHSPLFQVAFVFQNAPKQNLEFPGLDVSPVEIKGETAKFDLHLSVADDYQRLRVTAHYSTDLFNDATIARLLGHFGTLLEGITAHPGQHIAALPILTESERYQLLVKWNATKTVYPAEKCVHELFEEQVERSADAVALIFEDQHLSYREVNQRSNRLAHYLRKLGVGPEVLVGICMERSLDVVVGILGVLKAGGAYVPLDPQHPKERLEFVLKDTQVRVLLTQEKLKAGFDHQVIVSLDKDWEKIAEQSEENLANEVTTDNLAYVMYTSGSTGKPKGVEVSHRAVVRLLINTNYIQIEPSDAIAQISNCAFDAATFEIWGALLHGARLVIISTEVAIAPQEFSAALNRHQVSAVFLTTALFNQLAQNLPAIFRPIRHVLFGGEAIDPKWVRQILRFGAPGRLVHVYGPTETTTFTTWHEIKEVDEEVVTIPIGRPIANTTVYVLDPHFQPVPIGVAGELYIGGDGLARGYLNCPELTAEKFVSNPFSNEPGARLYKTGDLGRYRSDGHIEFLGRIDHQVKLRGYRVELGEIEAALGEHSAVQDNRVVMREAAPGDKRLVAYVVLKEGVIPTSSELRSYLKAKLPSYMVPSTFMTLEAFPLTTNGKLDCDALPPLRSNDTQQEVELVAPRDETERLLCRIWSQVLGVNRIGIDDNFFAIGGHSLLAAKLFARLDEAFGCSLPLGVLFAAPTIRSLAECYRAPVERKTLSVLVPLRTGGKLSPIFAVPGVFGNVIGFAALARELGSEQPFYGLQSVGLDGTESPVASIEEMATLYLEEMQSVQAHGPYAILGACFGATVAYEMTRQLLAAGEEVGFLGLLDPTRREGKRVAQKPSLAPRIFRRVAAVGSFLAERGQLYREELRRLSVRDRVKYLAAKFHLLSGLIGNPNAFKAAERELNQIEVYRANLLALDRYRRQPLGGRLRTLEVFQTTRPGRDNVPDGIDWQVLWKGSIKHHEVPGKDSGDMLSGQNARVLGALLGQQLHLAFHASRQPDCSENSRPDISLNEYRPPQARAAP